MRETILHLRPSAGRAIVGLRALCGEDPSAPDYHEITTAEYVTLHEPRRHVRGVICPRCADTFRAELRAYVKRSTSGTP